jgi:excinuclease ABC subunit C
VRVAERGDKRRLRELAEAQRQAGPGSGQAAGRAASPAAGGRARRPAGGARSGSLPVRIGASASPTWGRTTPWPRWSRSRAARRREADYRRFKVRGDRRGADRPPLEARPRGGGPDDCVGGGGPRAPHGSLLRQADRSPHDPDRDESFAALPDLILIDGGRGSCRRACAPSPLVERGRP